MSAVGLWLEIDVPDLELGIPNSLDSKFFGPLIKVMDEELDFVERMFNGVTDSWRSDHRPKWHRTSTKRKGQDLRSTIFTTSTPFVWVSGGHSGGYVAFTKDYRPRTRKGVLGSRARRGSVIVRGKRHAPKKRRVEAREFEFEIARRRNQPNKFPKRAQKALLKGARQAYGIRKRKKKRIGL